MSYFIARAERGGSGHESNDNQVSGGSLQEAAIQTCKYCQVVMHDLQRWADNEGWCGECPPAS